MNLLNFIVATKKSPNVYLFFPWMFKYFLFIFECCQYTMRMPMSDLFWLGFSENFGLANWCYSLVSQPVKKLPAMRGQGFNPWVRKIPWRRAWQPTPVFLPGRISQTEEYGSPQFMGSQRVRHDWATNTQHCKSCYYFTDYFKWTITFSYFSGSQLQIIILHFKT